MIDSIELPKTKIEYTADPEVPIAADYSLPEVEVIPGRPAPEVTSMDPVPDWVEEPSSMMAVARAAEKAGWQALCSYARGYVDAAKRGTYKIREFSNVWLYQPGRPRMVFTWERDPNSQAAEGPKWKATTALEFDSTGRAKDHGHMPGRRLL